MVIAAMMVAISVTGKVYAINIGLELRISYENLPVILSGIIMGTGRRICGRGMR